MRGRDLDIKIPGVDSGNCDSHDEIVTMRLAVLGFGKRVRAAIQAIRFLRDSFAYP